MSNPDPKKVDPKAKDKKSGSKELDDEALERVSGGVAAEPEHAPQKIKT